MSMTDEEKKLLEVIREIEWGQITVEIKQGKPVMVHKAMQDIKLTK